MLTWEDDLATGAAPPPTEGALAVIEPCALSHVARRAGNIVSQVTAIDRQ